LATIAKYLYEKVFSVYLEIIELTQGIDEKTQVFPGSPNPKILKWSNFAVNGYDSELIFTSTHVGTHIDSPAHFCNNGIPVDKIPLSRLVVFNKTKVLEIKKRNNDIIGVDDLKAFDINNNDTILINTGWSSNRFSDNYFKNNPGLSKQASEYLSDLQINLVGIDSPNIDPAIDENFNAHKVLSARNIPIIENLVNLDKIKGNSNFIFIALPLNLKGCSGSPIRAIAIIE
jgi:arylformamidase